MSKYNIYKLISIDNIYEFFEHSNYEIEDDRNPFPVSDLIKKPVDGEAWLIFNQTDLMILTVKAEKYNRKSYRNKINHYLLDLAGMKVVFFTNDFRDYHLTLIYDGIFSVKFNPIDPEMSALRVLESLEIGEELLDYIEQDINFILLKRELTVNDLKECIKDGNNSLVKKAFQDGGLRLIGEDSEKIIVAHEDSPIRDLVIDVKLESDKEEILTEDLMRVSDVYKENFERELKIFCLITTNGIIYYWNPYSISGFISFKNQLEEDVMDEILESLIAQVSLRTAFNSETFHQQFGIYSPFFILGISAFNKYFEEEYEKIKIIYNEWKDRFSKVYQAGDLDQELFVKHSYLSLLVKTALFTKFLGEINGNTEKDKIVADLEKVINIFEDRGIPIFLHDFFQWRIEDKFVQNEIFKALHNTEFYIDDLFRTIYQEMVSPSTRHALGEFYTPAPLAQKMVEEIYKFGDSILDPSCGSGTFLIEVLKSIYYSNHSLDEKIEAASKIYGFDVNPIAVLVARSNLLLLSDKMFKKDKKVPINVFLADSLNPIDEFDITSQFTTLDKWGTAKFGETERFNMSSINDSIVINVKFFKYSDKFGNLLKELDKKLSKKSKFDDIINSTYSSLDDKWLDEYCEGSSKETLRDNFEYIAENFYNLLKKEEDHIWAYLLFNALGVRKMKETIEGVDLLIGNPPWLTIHDILSHKYKDQIKEFLKNSGIYIGGKQAPHAELCSLFFYRCRDLYLKKNGKIFFVTTAALETGDQHSKFRMFKGFKDLFIWKFLEDVFNIQNICLAAIYGSQPLFDRLKIKTKIFNVKNIKKNWEFELINEEVYLPYNFKTLAKDKLAKRLVPLSKLNEMLSIKESNYINKFYQGASLVPRNLFFIDVKSQTGNNFIITPNKKVGSKKPWTFIPYYEIEVERQYIFDCAKSTDLVPFSLLSTYKIFLPVEKKLNFNRKKICPKAKILFEKLEKIYNEIQEKDERSITDLWENINHLNKLTNPMQLSNIKVIYNASGSLLKAAIVKNKIIVDTTLFYIGLDNTNEAYYLCAILNSLILSKNIKIIKSSRHIHKRPLTFPIPFYNENNKLHSEIVSLGKLLEEKIEIIINDLKEKELNNLKNKIQCIHCEKCYNQKVFENYRDDHEKSCSGVKNNYKWTKDDWLDLGNISKNDLKLKRNKVKNIISNNADLKEKFQKLDKLIIQLLSFKE